MYRSKNRSRRNEIKGPNSALTQFLQEEGISAESIKQRWLEHQEKQRNQEEGDSINEPDDEVEKISEDESQLDGKEINEEIKELLNLDEDTESDNEETRQASNRTSRIEANDSDEEEYDAGDNATMKVDKVAIEEDKRVTLALKRAKSKKVLESRRKKRKKAESLLDQKENTIPSLQELCLNKISENIILWQNRSNSQKNNPLFTQLRDTLGGISTTNLFKLSNALSKNRALDDSTLQLFLKTDLVDLTFYDCSKISYDGYKTLAIFSPHLKSLSLQMCGQLNNEALLYIAEKLPNLEALSLDGPFLINESTWNNFFDIMKGRLKKFHISNTHRFTDSNLISLLTNCSGILESLGLSRLDSIFNYAVIPQYLQNDMFHTLSIEYPYNEEDVSDEVVINILGQVGASLRSLTLTGCDELTDAMIINGMSAFLSGIDNVNTLLETLNVGGLDQLTPDSLVYFFSTVSLPSLTALDISRCRLLDDSVIQEVMLNSARNSLVKLTLNSVKLLTEEAFVMMACPNLEYIDLGFVRCVSDKVLGMLSRQNEHLKLVDVFGDNLVTDKVSIRKDITLVGRQSDSI